MTAPRRGLLYDEGYRDGYEAGLRAEPPGVCSEHCEPAEGFHTRGCRATRRAHRLAATLADHIKAADALAEAVERADCPDHPTEHCARAEDTRRAARAYRAMRAMPLGG